jgi:5-formyltetrahydrofolate cyclo-ligase
MTRDKQRLRDEIWDALRTSGDDLFPGAEGRIPNFKGREDAANRLSKLPAYRRADVLKVNPDSPQTPVREQALREGKTLYMAVPKLAERNCFLELDPDAMDGDPSDWASLTGASEHGTPVHPDSMPPVDAIVTGVVGVDPSGKRLGKGGGYSDLEFAILLEFGLIDRSIPILSTLHPTQELDEGRIPAEPQDISLSGYCLPDRSVSIDQTLARPDGLEPARLTAEQRNSIPILSELMDDPPQSAKESKP